MEFGKRLTKEEVEARLKKDMKWLENNASIKMYFNRSKKMYFFFDGILMDAWKMLRADGWTSVRFFIPQRIVRRPSVPDGIIHSVDDVLAVFAEGMTEIEPTFLREE